MEKYRNENWLRRQYREKERTQISIAEECGVAHSTIFRWIDKYNIEKKPRKYKDKSWLRKQYREKDRTQEEIAKECGVKRVTIGWWANKYGIQRKTKARKAREDPLDWSKDIAYLSGLITSDGYLGKDHPRIEFVSKDKSLVKQVQQISESNFNTNNCKIIKKDCYENIYWRYQFTSRRFYYFLEDIGLMSNKSNKMSKLDIPDNVFLDWLRGEVDGDGSFYKSKSGYLIFSIASGSKGLLEWVSDKLDEFNLVNGVGNVTIANNNGYQLHYAHNDSKSVASAIYSEADYCLERKYKIAKEFIGD